MAAACRGEFYETRKEDLPMADSEKAKKQVPLRISASLWNDLSQWAEDEFRSINGQIEYLLTECVKQHKKSGGTVPKDL